MIDAKKARFETKYRERVNEILTDCEKEIKAAISKGEYEANVSIYISNTSEEVYAEVLKQLEDLGYNTHLGDERIRTKDAPCDQCAYWEILKINWRD